MKTIEQLKELIRNKTAYVEKHRDDMKPREVSKHMNEIAEARRAILYLESSPAESFITSEISRVERLIGAKGDQFDVWKSTLPMGKHDPKKYKSMFRKESGILQFEAQLKTLNL